MILASLALLITAQADVKLPFVRPALATQPVSDDADDPAIWIKRSNYHQSVVYGTNKIKAPGGAIYAYNNQGKIIQVIRGLDRPNNIDVEYGLSMGNKGSTDIAVATERVAGRLRVFAISSNSGKLTDVTGNTKVQLAGLPDFGEPMGIALYRHDGRIYAFVSNKSGLADGYIEQYRLYWNSDGNKVDSQFVRRFGKFSQKKEIESMVVDDENGFLYYSDERAGIHKYNIKRPDILPPEEAFWPTPFRGDTEGLAIWKKPDGTGYLVATDQIPNATEFTFYKREGNNERVAVIRTPADETDGIEVSSYPISPTLWCGVLVAMDSKRKRFVYFNWAEFETTLFKGKQ